MGLHLLLDARATRRLDDADAIRVWIHEVVKLTGLTLKRIVKMEFPNGSDFGPGITAMAILAESNITIHTRPNEGLLNIDVYSCKAFPVEPVLALTRETFGLTEILQEQQIERH